MLLSRVRAPRRCRERPGHRRRHVPRHGPDLGREQGLLRLDHRPAMAMALLADHPPLDRRRRPARRAGARACAACRIQIAAPCAKNEPTLPFHRSRPCSSIVASVPLLAIGPQLTRTLPLAAWTPSPSPAGHYRFPEDHGAHPDFKTEWWYFTGKLRAPDGREFGYELTWFRQGVIPGLPAGILPFHCRGLQIRPLRRLRHSPPPDSTSHKRSPAARTAKPASAMGDPARSRGSMTGASPSNPPATGASPPQVQGPRARSTPHTPKASRHRRRARHQPQSRRRGPRLLLLLLHPHDAEGRLTLPRRRARRRDRGDMVRPRMGHQSTRTGPGRLGLVLRPALR